MDAMQRINVRELDTENVRENFERYERAFDSSYKHFKRFHLFNQFANAFFILLPIMLTLATAIFAVIGEGVTNHKIWVGILAALSVAVQAVATKFPVIERSKLYLKLRNDIRSLSLDLDSAVTSEELKQIKGKYDEILKEESLVP